MFEETRLNDKTSYGFVGGPRFNERVKTRPNGAERRNAMWSMPKFEYRAPYNRVPPDIYAQVYNAFMALDGKHVGFRFKDHNDYIGTSEALGTATGVEQVLQLKKHYTFGSRTKTREIYKPVDGTVVVYANGVEIVSTTDSTTGLVTCTAALGAALTADFEFDVPVRFDMDYLPWSHDAWKQMSTDLVLLELTRLNLDL